MGLYRTIPQDVEAVQFGGMKNEEPILKEMGTSIPSWLWRGITKGMVKFDTIGVKVGNTILKEGDWIIFDGAFIDSMSEEKFNSTFVPARKPLSEMVTAPKPKARKEWKGREVTDPEEKKTLLENAGVALTQAEQSNTTVTQAVPVNAPALMADAPTIGVPDEIPDEVDAIMSKLGRSTHTIDMAEPVTAGGAE